MRIADARRVREYITKLEAIVPPKLRPQATAIILDFDREFSTVDGRGTRDPESNAKISAAFARRRATEIFHVDRAEDGKRVEVIGWLNLARELSMSENSIRQRLSSGNNRFERSLPGRLDVVVWRTSSHAAEPDDTHANRLDALRTA